MILLGVLRGWELWKKQILRKRKPPKTLVLNKYGLFSLLRIGASP